MENSACLKALYSMVRAQSLRLTETLSVEDMAVQSMPDASPVKWHLAHTTWFFETFLLIPLQATGSEFRYQRFDPRFNYLFNSYYDAVGERHPRPHRGLLTRPSFDQIVSYRRHVDEAVESYLSRTPVDSKGEDILITGLHHEMQHQELLLTDILHALSFNPLYPAVQIFQEPESEASSSLTMLQFDGGLIEIGASPGDGFSYDCEQPRHKFFLQPYRLANRLVTNREWLEFIDDGGYKRSSLWLSDGWEARHQHQWQSPLYWRQQAGEWHQFTLAGLKPLNLDAPVCHISYYEAEAFARWAGKRLPSEQEWEHSVDGLPVVGNLLESANWCPTPVCSKADLLGESGKGLLQMYGDVWEWTRSAYSAYPGFQPAAGALQEYNGKFMANQFVLRGGSCVTPKRQLRPTYRNFFYPHQRWQFTGLRLAEDD